MVKFLNVFWSLFDASFDLVTQETDIVTVCNQEIPLFQNKGLFIKTST